VTFGIHIVDPLSVREHGLRRILLAFLLSAGDNAALVPHLRLFREAAPSLLDAF
jgi:hypothetical protein